MDDDDPLLDKKIPRELHITKVLKQHPWHPYSEDLPSEHACAEVNEIMGKCMTQQNNGQELYMMHVNCFTDKVNLMKCLVKERKRARAAAASDS
eukprot:gene12282-18986_t